MNGFGRRSGMGGNSGGGRPSFGVARPMHGPTPARAADLDSGQFPPVPLPGTADPMPGEIAAPAPQGDAMQRLAVPPPASRACSR